MVQAHVGTSRAQQHADPLISVTNAKKTYGSTHALTGVTLSVTPGEVRGIVGHNGAGKSTLMRILSGIETIDSGSISVCGRTRPVGSTFPGVRMAFQETLLAGELTVADNAYLSAKKMFPGFSGRQKARAAIAARLAEIFPGNTIKTGDYIDDLSLAGRQMVEIARATLSDDLKILILDEPTESLTSEATKNLYSYVKKIAASGTAVLLISHRLNEIISTSTQVTVLKDGAAVDTVSTANLTPDDLFIAMGGEDVPAAQHAAARTTVRSEKTVRVPIIDIDGNKTEISAHKGEIVGLAGIAGQGQEEILEQIWRGGRGIKVSGTCSYVPGDRQRFGIFPLWNVGENISISSLQQHSRGGIRQREKEKGTIDSWVSALKIRGGKSAMMTALSGGNQQKVIVARAFATDAPTILLNDPFRGVDVHTKTELYALLRREAEAGRSIIWYSSENAEMQHCDRAYVLRAKKLVGELASTEIDDAAIISLSFGARKQQS